MKNDKDNYEIPFYGQMAGRAEFSQIELDCLRAAGINPDMLNAMDRAAVIHALMVNFDLIKNPRAGDIAAILFQFGLLQDLLDGEKRKEQEELDEEKKKKKEKERREREEQMLQAEIMRMQAMQAGEYVAQNPLPNYITDYYLNYNQSNLEVEFANSTNVTGITDFALPFIEALNAINIFPAIERSVIDKQVGDVPLATLADDIVASPTPIGLVNVDLKDVNLANLANITLALSSKDVDEPIRATNTPDTQEKTPVNSGVVI